MKHWPPHWIALCVTLTTWIHRGDYQGQFVSAASNGGEHPKLMPLQTFNSVCMLDYLVSRNDVVKITHLLVSRFRELFICLRLR